MKERTYLFFTILGIAVFGAFLHSMYDRTSVFAGSGTQGDPYTVCAAGCDYTTITAASAAVGSGDYIEVQSGYVSSSESYPLIINEHQFVTCQDASVVIGNESKASADISVGASSTIVGCTFEFTGYIGGDPTAELTLAEGATISSSTLIDMQISFNTSTSITSSTVLHQEMFGNMLVVKRPDVQILNNTLINSHTGESSTNYAVISDSNYNIDRLLVVSNTISVASSSGSRLIGFYKSGADVVIRGNKAQFGGTYGSFMYGRWGDRDTSIVLTHNTFWAHEFSGTMIAFADDDTDIIYSMQVTSTYNVFYKDSVGSASGTVAFSFYSNLEDTRLYEDYNGYARLYDPPYSTGGDLATLVSSGGNSQEIAISPIRDANLDASDDFELNPISSFLDVNGTVDIGAVPGVRGSSFFVDDTCDIDYTTCHATSTVAISANIRSGDTWAVASGTYAPFAVTTSSVATSSITILGTYPAIIEGNVNTPYGISVHGFADVTIGSFVIQDVTTTVRSDYELSNAIYSYAGNDYNSNLGDGADRSRVLYGNAGCESEAYDRLYQNGNEDTIFDGSSDWHLALASTNAFGPTAYLTFWVPNNVAATKAAVEGGGCGGFGVTIDAWVTSTFANTDGTYTYDAAAVASAGVTMVDGFTDPPTLTSVVTPASGLLLQNVSDVTVDHVTSTANNYGLYIDTAAGSITLTSSTIQSSLAYDVYASTTQDHTFRNVMFTPASTTIAGGGTLIGQYRTRAYVQATSTDPLAGVRVTVQNLKGTADVVTTTLTGYTPYTDYITVFVLQGGDVGITAGGYNPFTITAAATSSYSATSTSSNIYTPQGTVELVMHIGPSAAPNAPSDVSISDSTRTDSTLDVSWTDNSGTESSFLIDYIVGTDVADFPGTTSTVGANVTSTTLMALPPNTAFTIRVGARNVIGVSSYATSSPVYTLAAAPGKPSITDVSDTTMDVRWSGGNATGTVYHLVNVTASSTVATTTSRSYTVTGLTPETSYQFKVRAMHIDPISARWTAYSGVSTATSTSAVGEEEDNTPGGGGGGGGRAILPNTPQLPTGVDAVNGALLINSGDPSTDNVQVVLNINASHVAEMAISNSSNFTGVSFLPFSATVSHTLAPGNGEKRVYVKLRSSEGGTLTITDTIVLTGASFDAPPTTDTNCLLPPESAAKSGASNAVYYITLDCTKRAFANAATYFTYFTSWDDVLVTTQSTLDSIPNDTLGFMPWGPLYNPASGSLVKTPSDPKTYLLLDGTLYHIANEAAAEYQFGPAWATWIEDVDAKLLTNYPISSQILGTSTRPNGILIKYANNPKVYQLAEENSTQVKRWIVDTATFNALNFRDDRIVTIPETESYPDGTNLGTSVLTSTPPNYVFTTLLQMGDRGLEVIYLQDRLKTLGYFPIEVVSNGVYGPTTDISVRALQTERGLNVNGTTDAPTRAVLNS